MQFVEVEQEFLLVCESVMEAEGQLGRWRFVLERLDGTPFLEASDTEPGDRNRLSLWAIVRGLEALPGPSAVTMLTSSRYVIRSLSESLPRWRAAGFMWEHFGQRLPVTNADLWQRISRGLDIHAVSACCVAAAPGVALASSNRFASARAPHGVAIGMGAADGVGAASDWTARGERARTGPEAGVASGPRTRVSDGLRRWLLAQCRAVTAGYGTDGCHAGSPQVAAA